MSESVEFNPNIDFSTARDSIFDDTQPLPLIPESHPLLLSQRHRQRNRWNTVIPTTTMPRRTVLKVAAGIIGGAVIAKTGLERITDNDPSSEEQRYSIQQTQEAERVESVEPMTTKDKLNKILGMELFVYERNLEEQKFAEEAESLDDVDLGLNVCADMSARSHLMHKRNQLREKGHEGMTLLTDAQKQFCKEEDITEEVLGMCLDVYDQAKVMITHLQDTLRDDEEGKITDPENLMINVGGMAKLIMEETNGFINVGQAKAYTQLFILDKNLMKDIPDENNKRNLDKLCELANLNTGLQYNPENIPGSERGDTSVNSSGGAIGIQFMPDRALEYYNKIVVEGGFDPKKEGNIFDPLQSIKMAWTFIACHERVAPGPDGFRWGYMRGNAKAIDFAIRKWNDLDSEVNAIKNSSEEYSALENSHSID